MDLEEKNRPKVETLPGRNQVKTVQLRISKKVLWISGGILLLLVAAGLAYKLGWYQSIVDKRNAAAVTIKVKEADKYELEGAKLEIGGQSLVSGSHGKISLSLVAGTYEFILSKDGYTPLKHNLSLHRGDNDLQVLSLTKLPDKLFTVKGFVQDYVSGAALVNVQVTLGGSTVATDPSGAYTFTKIAPGDQKLVYSKAGYKNLEQTVKVENDNVVSSKVPLVPSGQVIFVSNGDGKRGLYTINYDGNGRNALVAPQNGGEDFSPLLSPDNKHVLFSSTRDGIKDNYGNDLVRLYIAGSDGKDVKKIADDVSPSFTPIWAPDSQHLYFSGFTTARQEQATHKIYDVSKGTVLDIGEEATNVVFSPDGSKLAYTVTGTEDRTVVLATPTPTVTPDASASPAVTATPTPSPTPTATPEVTTTKVNVNILKLFTLSTGERKILTRREQYMSDLRFGSDSKSVSYEVIVDSGRKRLEYNLTNDKEAEIAVLAYNRRRYISSPDATLQAFIEERDGKKDLFIVDKNEKNEKRLTTLGYVNDALEPHWDESGHYLSFAVKREAENALYVVAASGGDPKKVTDFFVQTQN